MVVKANILKKIKLTVPMVGGHISDVQLHQQKSPNAQAYNIPDLHDMVRASFTPKPDAGHMESLLDFGRKDIIGE